MRKISIALALIGSLLSIPAHADFTGKDASAATITFKNPNVCTSVACVPIFQLTDGAGAAFGVTGSPLFISFGTGVTLPAYASPPTVNLGTIGAAATAANQTSQITQETAIAGASGTTTDAPCTLPATTTACTQTAIQKAFANAANSPPPLGSASGGISTKTLAALTSTAIAVKAAAGQVYSGQCSNADATHWAYLQIFNVAAASVTMGTTAPTKFVGIPPASNAGFAYSLVGLQYSTAISAGAASTSTGGTAPTTTLDCTVDYN